MAYTTTFSRLRLGLGALACLLAACAPFQTNESGFTQVPDAEARTILDGIAAMTAQWHAVKCKFDCEFVSMREGKAETHKAAAVLFWVPGSRLRVRLKRMGTSVADVLYDGTRWYLTDEGEGIVYLCNRIDTVRAGSIQHDFLAYLQFVPDGWCPDARTPCDVFSNSEVCRVEHERRGARIAALFPSGSGFPSEVRIGSSDGSRFTAWFSAPETNAAPQAQTFVPVLEGYEVHDLDAGTIKKP